MAELCQLRPLTQATGEPTGPYSPWHLLESKGLFVLCFTWLFYHKNSLSKFFHFHNVVSYLTKSNNCI